MVTGILGSTYITVTNNTSGVNYTPNTNPLSGTVRYTFNGGVEIYNGHSWQPVYQTPSIMLNTEATNAISWAIKKMQEEKEIEQKSKNHPAIKAAFDALKKAEEQLKITLILSENEKTSS